MSVSNYSYKAAGFWAAIMGRVCEDLPRASFGEMPSNVKRVNGEYYVDGTYSKVVKKKSKKKDDKDNEDKTTTTKATTTKGATQAPTAAPTQATTAAPTQATETHTDPPETHTDPPETHTDPPAEDGN